MVYLIDTKNGKKQIVRQNPWTEFYSDDWRETVADNLPWFGEAVRGNKIVVMTYAKFGILAEQYRRFGYDFEVILCDEIHSLPKFRSYKSENGKANPHIPAQKRLEEIINKSKVKVIGISATPERAEKELTCPIRRITVENDVHRLETIETIPYTNKFRLLDELSPNDTGIVFISRITGMMDFQAEAAAKGFRAICVWSENNQEHPMTQEQKNAGEYILSHEELPPQYNMVIINASSETGINIRGKVDYIVVHSQAEETQIQIRGRYRQNLKRLYLLDYSTLSVPDEFLDTDLDKEQKDQLCAAVALRDEKGRIYKWTTVKEKIIAAGYSVVEKRVKNKRYHRITL